MQINKTDNVIFLKNAESNIIEEAFVILKKNIKINKQSENNNVNQIKEIDVLKEAEELINHKIIQNNIEYEKFKLNKLERKIKILKIMNITFVMLLVGLTIVK